MESYHSLRPQSQHDDVENGLHDGQLEHQVTQRWQFTPGEVDQLADSAPIGMYGNLSTDKKKAMLRITLRPCRIGR